MKRFRLLLGALFISTVALGLTRTRTDEITSRDDLAVAFPGGIVAPISNGNFYTSLVYPAIVTGVANLDSVTSPASLKYDRAGNYVHVWGQVTLNPTSGSQTLTTFRLTLPVPPSVAFVGSSAGFGTAGLPTTIANGTCNAKHGFKHVECTYGAVSTTADLVNVNFTYTISGN